MVYFLIAAFLIVLAIIKESQKQEQIRQEQLNIAAEETKQIKAKLNADVDKHKKDIEVLSKKWGKCTIDVPIKEYYIGTYYSTQYTGPIEYISVFEDSKIVVIRSVEYSFSDILGCSLIDDTTSKTITTSIGDVKTSTGNMFGRAVVGGILTGGVGAIAGAVTAKKNISTTETSQNITTHKYTIYVNVKSLTAPTITIPIGEKRQKAKDLMNLFNIIITEGQSNRQDMK